MTNPLSQCSPCPFCGHRDIKFYNDGTGWVAECRSCPAELRWFASYDEALQGWNKRHAAEPPEQPLGLGDPVTYAPRYPSQLPREGWTVECLPPEPVYVIRHPTGSVIAVSEREVHAVKSGDVG